MDALGHDVAPPMEGRASQGKVTAPHQAWGAKDMTQTTTSRPLRAVALTAAIAMTAAACNTTGAGMGPGGRPTAEQVRNERVAQGAGVGCAGGAVAGALLGALVSRNRGQGALMGAAAGCAVGGVAGASYGSYVDARAQSFANAQDRYAALVSGAEGSLRQARRYNATIRDEVASQQRRVGELNARLRANQISQAEYRQQTVSASTTLREMRQQVADLNKTIADVSQDIASMRGSVSSVADLSAKRAALIEERAALNTMISQLSNTAEQGELAS